MRPLPKRLILYVENGVPHLQVSKKQGIRLSLEAMLAVTPMGVFYERKARKMFEGVWPEGTWFFRFVSIPNQQDPSQSPFLGLVFPGLAMHIVFSESDDRYHLVGPGALRLHKYNKKEKEGAGSRFDCDTNDSEQKGALRLPYYRPLSKRQHMLSLQENFSELQACG